MESLHRKIFQHSLHVEKVQVNFVIQEEKRDCEDKICGNLMTKSDDDRSYRHR